MRHAMRSRSPSSRSPDTHVTDAESVVQTMIDDLGVVNRISDSPAFVVATGDLTNQGKRPEEMQGYVRAVTSCRVPYYNIIGNHDYGGAPRTTGNYERYIGPRYYSFNAGRYHFIAKDIMAADFDKEAYERQTRWIEKDIAMNAADRRIIVLQHFLPKNAELEWWSRYKTAAIFSGHWHGRRERMYKGILDVNSATFRFGGIDRSPRGFRIVHVNGDTINCEWRTGQQDKRIEIVHPGPARRWVAAIFTCKSWRTTRRCVSTRSSTASNCRARRGGRAAQNLLAS